jgi:hypothetical protein
MAELLRAIGRIAKLAVSGTWAGTLTRQVIHTERHAQRIIGFRNIKEATLFPRDMKRLAP